MHKEISEELDPNSVERRGIACDSCQDAAARGSAKKLLGFCRFTDKTNFLSSTVGGNNLGHTSKRIFS